MHGYNSTESNGDESRRRKLSHVVHIVTNLSDDVRKKIQYKTNGEFYSNALRPLLLQGSQYQISSVSLPCQCILSGPGRED